MRIIDLGLETGKSVPEYGSVGLRALGVVRSESVAVTVLGIPAGGEIGRHPTVVDQLLLVVDGAGEVCGADGVWHSVHSGHGVLWGAGELHTTRTATGLAAIAVEMDQLARFLTR